jgi:hypothetical protein
LSSKIKILFSISVTQFGTDGRGYFRDQGITEKKVNLRELRQTASSAYPVISPLIRSRAAATAVIGVISAEMILHQHLRRRGACGFNVQEGLRTGRRKLEGIRRVLHQRVRQFLQVDHFAQHTQLLILEIKDTDIHTDMQTDMQTGKNCLGPWDRDENWPDCLSHSPKKASDKKQKGKNGSAPQSWLVAQLHIPCLAVDASFPPDR